MARELTGKQRMFIEAYLQCFSGVEAARRAGYKGKYNTLAVVASENLQKRAIREQIDRRLAELQVKIPEGVAKKRVRKKACFVYLVRAENGLVKIGKTVDVASRFNTLNTTSPIDLELMGYICSDCAGEIERALHSKFANVRARGEWFALVHEDIEWIGKNYVITYG